MCMASVDREPIDALAASKKHPREEDSSIPLDAPSEPLLKRCCVSVGASDTGASHPGFLDVLYEFENSLDVSAVESVTQEELLTEMMRSLEKVIGAIDENSLPEPPVSGEATQSLGVRQFGDSGVEDLPSIAPTDTFDLDLQSRRLSANPCISTVSSADQLSEAVSDDWEVLESFFPELELESGTLPSAAAPDGAWLDDNFDHLDVTTFSEFSRDYSDLISLDSVI